MGRSSGRPVAWLSLDESDKDLSRFLGYLIAALQTTEAEQGSVGTIGEGALRALQAPQPPPVEALLTTLINDIAAIPDRIVLVVDDYHVVEAAGFLNQVMGLSLSTEDITALETRTEGWIAGLHVRPPV